MCAASGPAWMVNKWTNPFPPPEQNHPYMVFARGILHSLLHLAASAVSFPKHSLQKHEGFVQSAWRGAWKGERNKNTKASSPCHAPERNASGGASGCYRVTEGNQTCFSALSKVVYGFRVPRCSQIGVGCRHGCFLSPQKPRSHTGHAGMRDSQVTLVSSARLAFANMAHAHFFRPNETLAAFMLSPVPYLSNTALNWVAIWHSNRGWKESKPTTCFFFWGGGCIYLFIFSGEGEVFSLLFLAHILNWLLSVWESLWGKNQDVWMARTILTTSPRRFHLSSPIAN